ncbi:hypothetical protein M422DRAFT_245376 [Sphaerobolus stellatus SS14]|nr:hypothetical protein M422DRAFT_245376 [Sphaerobolus stellatus SS14]
MRVYNFQKCDTADTICLCTQQVLDATESCLDCLVEISTQLKDKTASQQILDIFVKNCRQAGHTINGVSSAPTIIAYPGSGVPTAMSASKASNGGVAVLAVKGTVAVLAFAGSIALL